MERLQKTINFDVEEGRVTGRIAEQINSTKRRGQSMELLRNWMAAGKLLDECGNGVLQYLLAREKEAPEASTKQRLTDLKTYLDRIDLDTVQLNEPKPTNAAVQLNEPKPTNKPAKGKTRKSFLD